MFARLVHLQPPDPALKHVAQICKDYSIPVINDYEFVCRVRLVWR